MIVPQFVEQTELEVPYTRTGHYERAVQDRILCCIGIDLLRTPLWPFSLSIPKFETSAFFGLLLSLKLPSSRIKTSLWSQFLTCWMTSLTLDSETLEDSVTITPGTWERFVGWTMLTRREKIERRRESTRREEEERQPSIFPPQFQEFLSRSCLFLSVFFYFLFSIFVCRPFRLSLWCRRAVANSAF